MSTQITGKALAPFKQLIHDLDQGFREQNIHKIMSKFVPDNDVYSFGLVRDNDSKPALERHWQAQFGNYKASGNREEHYTVYVYGEAACLCLAHRIEGSSSAYTRLTLFLENHNGAWLIRHRHHSQGV